MPEFMDVHRHGGITPEGLMEAHNADLAIQDDEKVNFKHAWADPETGMVFCLSEAPNADGGAEDPRAGRPQGRQRVRDAGPGVGAVPVAGRDEHAGSRRDAD